MAAPNRRTSTRTLRRLACELAQLVHTRGPQDILKLEGADVEDRQIPFTDRGAATGLVGALVNDQDTVVNAQRKGSAEKRLQISELRWGVRLDDLQDAEILLVEKNTAAVVHVCRHGATGRIIRIRHLFPEPVRGIAFLAFVHVTLDEIDVLQDPFLFAEVHIDAETATIASTIGHRAAPRETGAEDVIVDFELGMMGIGVLAEDWAGAHVLSYSAT